MKITERLRGVTRLFLDTAPLIYFVEKNPSFLNIVRPVFNRIDAGDLTAVTSVVTLAECLIYPYRSGQMDVVKAFTDLIVSGPNTVFIPLDQGIAQQSAELRARYNLALPDALQIAAALSTSCDAFLTNDIRLKRVTELDMIVLDEVESA